MAALSLLGSGCSSSLDSHGYPAELRYPSRQDLIIKGGLNQELRVIPPPGMLDASLIKASEPTTVTKYDPREVSKEHRAEIRSTIDEIFGTPARPSIEPIGPDDLSKSAKKDEAKVKDATENQALYNKYLGLALQDADVKLPDIDDLKVDRGVLKDGSRLYRRHCMHCHGLNGDGRGPTGPWVNPHPRDYRLGKFKFISTNLLAMGRKPRRADLSRTIMKGIEGTSMPAFGLLSEKEIDAMVSYVIHLSIRGQVEHDTFASLLANSSDIKTMDGESLRTHVYNRSTVVLASWVDANKRKPIEPPEYIYSKLEMPKGLDPDPKTDEGKAKLKEYETKLKEDEATLGVSVRNGYQIFIGDKGGCVACHTDFGRQAPYKYDDWGTLVQARNLTVGTYRGGRRPIDLHWRIAGGIDPSGMKATKLDPKELWDLIHFVQALPYPRMLPDDVRKKVYGASEPKRDSDSRASR